MPKKKSKVLEEQMQKTIEKHYLSSSSKTFLNTYTYLKKKFW